MALTEEQLSLQLAILTSKTADNADMTYSGIVSRNKGLNPNYFSGNYTAIVNALNSMYKNMVDVSDNSKATVKTVSDKLGSEDSEESIAAWTELKNKIQEINSTYTTITQGMLGILTGNAIAQMFNVTTADKGKVLTIDTDEEGKVIVKTISATSAGAVTVETLEYVNENYTELTNVKLAIDYLLANNTTTIKWNDIEGKPNVPDTLNLTETELELKSGDSVISTVTMVDSIDITEIVDSLI